VAEREEPGIETYRAPASSRLQALLHGGELAPVRPSFYMPGELRPSQWVIVMASVAALLLMVRDAGWMIALALAVLVGSIHDDRKNVRLGVKILRRLRIEFEVQLRSVTVPLGGWPFDGSDHTLSLAAIEVEVDHDPDQLERAVRLGEPRATLTFIADRVLRVEFAWDRDPLGLERLDRLLFGVLLTHADELGVVRIRFRTPHESLTADQPAQK
jgi:hypothetical protein